MPRIKNTGFLSPLSLHDCKQAFHNSGGLVHWDFRRVCRTVPKEYKRAWIEVWKQVIQQWVAGPVEMQAKPSEMQRLSPDMHTCSRCAYVQGTVVTECKRCAWWAGVKDTAEFEEIHWLMGDEGEEVVVELRKVGGKNIVISVE